MIFQTKAKLGVMELIQISEACRNKVSSYQKYCRKCASHDKRYTPNQYHSYTKRSEPTTYTLELAKAFRWQSTWLDYENFG